MSDPNAGLKCDGTPGKPGQVWLGSQPYGSPGESYAPCNGCENCRTPVATMEGLNRLMHGFGCPGEHGEYPMPVSGAGGGVEGSSGKTAGEGMDSSGQVVGLTPAPLTGTVVPDLGKDEIVIPDLEVRRASIANAEVLYFIAEHDRPEGVPMQEVMMHFHMGAMQQGHLALSMKDAVQSGYAEQVAPRGDPYAWRVTDRGLAELGLAERTEAPPVDPEVLRADAIAMHGSSNVMLPHVREAFERRAQGLPPAEVVEAPKELARPCQYDDPRASLDPPKGRCDCGCGRVR